MTSTNDSATAMRRAEPAPKRGRGRPARYKTDAERKAAKAAQNLEAQHRRRGKLPALPGKPAVAPFVDRRRNPNKEITAIIKAIYNALVSGGAVPGWGDERAKSDSPVFLGVPMTPDEARVWAPRLAQLRRDGFDSDNRTRTVAPFYITDEMAEVLSGDKMPARGARKKGLGYYDSL
jgi:hypothetical protein